MFSFVILSNIKTFEVEKIFFLGLLCLASRSHLKRYVMSLIKPLSKSGHMYILVTYYEHKLSDVKCGLQYCLPQFRHASGFQNFVGTRLCFGCNMPPLSPDWNIVKISGNIWWDSVPNVLICTGTPAGNRNYIDIIHGL